MRRFDLHGLELFSLDTLRLTPEARVQYGSRLTEEFSGLELADATRFQGQYPEAYANPEDASDDRVPVFGNVFVLRRDDWTLVVDTGIGVASAERRAIFQLPAELEAAGIERDAVNAVFLTHHHPDHIGWVCSDAMPNFPNARHYFPAADLGPLQTQNPELYATQIAPLLESGWLETVEEFQTVAPGVTALGLPGHTPGQLGLWVDHTAPVIVAADALHYPMQVDCPDWQSRADADSPLAVRTRHGLLAQAAGIEALLCLTHVAGAGVGRVRARDAGWTWVAAEASP